MATPPQGAGNSNDLRTPVNATQGARDFLVNDDYQFNFDDFLGPRPSDTTNSDAAQQDSRATSTLAASGNTLLDSPHFQFSGSTPVTVGQDADRLINELDRDRAVKLRLFRDMCAAFDQAASGYASGPGLGTPSPRSSSRRPTKRATQRAKAPPAEDLRLLVRLEPDAPTWDKEAYAIRRAMGWAIKPTDAPTRDLLLAKEASWSSTLGASKVDRHEVWHTYVVRNCPRRLFSLTEESIDVLEAAKEEVLTQTAWQPVDKPIAELQDASFAKRRSLVGATVSLSPILSSSE
ncbi:hypothetical protein E4U27_004217 [Claviceps purpurea]|nr:hypothetical protein E4U27_004217 [Claviceps purpurea]